MVAVGASPRILVDNILGALKGSDKKCRAPSGPESFFSILPVPWVAPTAIVVSSLRDEDRLISNKNYFNAYGRDACPTFHSARNDRATPRATECIRHGCEN